MAAEGKLLTQRTAEQAVMQSIADGEMQRARKIFTIDDADGLGLA